MLAQCCDLQYWQHKYKYKNEDAQQEELGDLQGTKQMLQHCYHALACPFTNNSTNHDHQSCQNASDEETTKKT